MRALLPHLAHALPLFWLFGPLLTGEGALLLRDTLVTYWPDYSFLARSLSDGVWPLWNPHAYGGLPFLKAYPGDILLALLLGAPGVLSTGVVLHLLIGMCGMTALARSEGVSVRGSWLAGTAFGLSGVVLSSVTLLQLLQAAAWAPWVIRAFLSWRREPRWRRAATLALFAAIQGSTLSAEVVLQTAIAGVVLGGRGLDVGRPLTHGFRQLAVAFLIAALLAAPAVWGALDLLADTRRGAGFSTGEVLAQSASGPTLLEGLAPRLFGPALWYAEPDGWGHAYFPAGVPYFLSVYLGPTVFGLALASRDPRLLTLAAFGVLLGLGAHGPFPWALGRASLVRFPVKFLFLSTFALAFAAARGHDRLAGARGNARWLAAAPAAILLAAGLALRMAPESGCDALARLWPSAGTAARAACVGHWPDAWAISGLLGVLAAGIVSLARWSFAVVPLLALDLSIVNAPLNPVVPAEFLRLGREVADAIETSREQGARWFSYGVNLDEGRTWDLPGRGRNLLALYRLMRQALAPPTQAMDAVDGVFDGERTGWEPRNTSLGSDGMRPASFARVVSRLREEGIGWVLSFETLPVLDPPAADLVRELRVEGTPRPLRLYAVRNVRPRAYWVPRCETANDGDAAWLRATSAEFDAVGTVVLEGKCPQLPSADAPGPARVTWTRVGPHHLRIEAETPPGFLVVLETHRDAWRLEGGRAVLRANGRHWALATPGGPQAYDIRYEPTWPVPALSCAVIGLALTLVLALRDRG